MYIVCYIENYLYYIRQIGKSKRRELNEMLSFSEKVTIAIRVRFSLQLNSQKAVYPTAVQLFTM